MSLLSRFRFWRLSRLRVQYHAYLKSYMAAALARDELAMLGFMKGMSRCQTAMEAIHSKLRNTRWP